MIAFAKAINPRSSCRGDLEREFEARLSESSTLAFRVAVGVLRHREDAEDVAQEALTKAYLSFGQLREPHRFQAWLARITWRLALNRRRSDLLRTMREAIGLDVTGVPTALEELLASERSGRLWQSIDTLPENLRTVTVLAGIRQHEIREVALLLQLPEGTVKKRLFIARQRLKELLR